MRFVRVRDVFTFNVDGLMLAGFGRRNVRELAREFVPEMTGGQITLSGCRGCLDVRDLRESGENCVSFW